MKTAYNCASVKRLPWRYNNKSSHTPRLVQLDNCKKILWQCPRALSHTPHQKQNKSFRHMGSQIEVTELEKGTFLQQ